MWRQSEKARCRTIPPRRVSWSRRADRFFRDLVRTRLEVLHLALGSLPIRKCGEECLHLELSKLPQDLTSLTYRTQDTNIFHMYYVCKQETMCPSSDFQKLQDKNCRAPDERSSFTTSPVFLPSRNVHNRRIRKRVHRLSKEKLIFSPDCGPFTRRLKPARQTNI